MLSFRCLFGSHRRPSLRLPLAVALAASGLLAALPACAQTAANTIVSDPRVQLFDLEFDQPSARFAYSSSTDGSVWLGYVNPTTGDLLPSSGQGTLIGTQAESPVEACNGPEWAYSNQGPQIVYNKVLNGYANLARTLKMGDLWNDEALVNGLNGVGPVGSKDRNDPRPRISYAGAGFCGPPATKSIDAGGGIYWREIADPSTVHQIPLANAQGVRWVPGATVGQRSLAVSAAVVGPDGKKYRQAFRYWIDTGVAEQLTSDLSDHNSVFFWNAPEYNNELLFFTLINDQAAAVYRQINGVWTNIYTIKSPDPSKPYIESPEPFTHNGKSYAFYVVKDNSDSTNKDAPSEIYVTNIDPSAPLNRKVSSDPPGDPLSGKKVRKDPEVFVTKLGPVIFYAAASGLDLNGDGQPDQNAVIWKADTGLGPPQPNDFNGDGKSDILWRNANTGANRIWLMNGATRLSTASLPTIAASTYLLVGGSADFTGDGRADIFWHNPVNGTNILWKMSGTAVVQTINLYTSPDLVWEAAATGDFNSDGATDILWRRRDTGELSVWLMDNTTFVSAVHLPANPGLDWKVGGTGDFNNDSQTDIVLRNSKTGANQIWLMNGTNRTGTVALPTVGDPNWAMRGIADYDNDGNLDILWRYQGTGTLQGAVQYWKMNGVNYTASVSLPTDADLNWTIIGPR